MDFSSFFVAFSENPLNLNGEFIFGAKLKEDSCFENQVSREREDGREKQISCVLHNSNQFTQFGVNFKHHESISPQETYNIKVYEVEI